MPPLDPATAFATFAARARGVRPAGFALARSIATGLAREALASVAQDTLARAHEAGLAHLRAIDHPGVALLSDTPEVASLLDVKVELARRLLAPCVACGLRCGVDRRAGPAGVCGLGSGLRRYADFVHLGEERELVPAHAVFLAGCSYRCAYCSDWDHVATPLRDPETSPDALARSIEARRAEGAACVSFVGGDPLVSFPAILDVLARARADTPVVFTTNAHASEEGLAVLDGVVDAWVLDWKHGSDACAKAVARAPDHNAVLARTLAWAAARAFVIVRHLVIPGHVECCSLPALDAIARVVPGARVNVMGQYRPIPRLQGQPLDRRPDDREVDRAAEHAHALGLGLAPLGSPSPPRGTAAAKAAPAGFESAILVDPDGRVTFENLAPDLAEVASDLAGDDPDLAARQAAAAPWIERPRPGAGGAAEP